MNNIESRKPVQLPLWDSSTRIQCRNQIHPELMQRLKQDTHEKARAEERKVAEGNQRIELVGNYEKLKSNA